MIRGQRVGDDGGGQDRHEHAEHQSGQRLQDLPVGHAAGGLDRRLDGGAAASGGSEGVVTAVMLCPYWKVLPGC